MRKEYGPKCESGTKIVSCAIMYTGVTLALTHLATNVNWKTPPARIVITAHRPHLRTKQPISNTLRSGHHGLPSLQKTLLSFGLSVSIASADPNYSYRRHKMDPLESLTNTTWHHGK